jgi:hypothetical protein
MTEKELRGLSRADLLELLIEQTKKNELLQQQLDEATAKLQSRELTISNAGSIAEASLQLSGIFEAAQTAGEQYLQNIRRLSHSQAQICAEMERQTRKKCDEMLRQTEEDAQLYWDQIAQRLDAYYKEHPGLKQELAAQPAQPVQESCDEA